MIAAGPDEGTAGAASRVRLVAWETTRRCPLKCRHCRGSARDLLYEGELTFPEARLLIDNIASFARPTLILTGGEPMFREDIYDIARHAAGRGLRVVMSPCGHLIDKRTARLIRESGIAALSISLDGARPETHDAFRGVSGAFSRSIRGIGYLREEGIRFQVNTTVTKINIGELDGLLELAKRLGAVAFNPFFLVPTGRGAGLSGLELSAGQYERSLRWIRDKSRIEAIEVRPTCAPHYNRVRLTDDFAGEFQTGRVRPRGCLGGDEFIFISHVGQVQPCGFLDIDCGNVRSAGFDVEQILSHSQDLIAIRDRSRYKGKCRACEFLETCGGCRARAFAASGDYLAEEPYCVWTPRKARLVAEGASYG